jgi:hypothetical protein
MRMRTDRIIVDGTIAEVNDFLEDFKKDFIFAIVDEDCYTESNKRLVILQLLDGYSLVIDNK